MTRLLLLALCAVAAPVRAQTVILPPTLVKDEPAALRVEGLAPGARATLELERTGPGLAAVGRSDFIVAADGVIDPARDAPVSGYAGVDPAGPFWSMAPVRTGAVQQAALTVRVRVADRLVASASAPVLDMAPTLRVEDVPAFAGARLYRPNVGNRLPVVVMLGGSEGGASFGRAMGPRLAAQGYAVLALPYYNAGWGGAPIAGLPTGFADIPVDRLEAVHRWIATRPDLDPRRIGLYGVSKGGEFAMLAATRFRWLAAVVAIVPSDVVWEGWGTRDPEGTRSSFAWRGRPLPFVPYRGMAASLAALGRGERAALAVPHLEGRRAHPERAATARIPVERYRGPLLLAGGDRDQTWPSGEMVRAIAERRAAAGRTTLAVTFADAGHGLAGTGWAPLAYPGAEADAPAAARAQARLWGETLRFLRTHLQPR